MILRFFSSLAMLVTVGLSAPALAQTVPGYCNKYTNNANYLRAISVVARNMRYTEAQLCTLPHLMDIYVTDRVFYRPPSNQPDPHVWVTLHYNEHSCQYFVRLADWRVSQANCYNTF